MELNKSVGSGSLLIAAPSKPPIHRGLTVIDYKLPGGTAGGLYSPSLDAPTATAQALMEDLLMQKRQDADRIASLEYEVADLKEIVAGLTAIFDSAEVGEPRKVTKPAAKKEIKKYFEEHHGKALYPSDVSEALNLSYELVSDIMDALEEGGEIALA